MSKTRKIYNKRGLVVAFIIVFASLGTLLLINGFATVSPTSIGFESANDPKCTGGINTTAGNSNFAQDTSKKYEGTYSAKASYTGGGANAYARCVVTTSWVTGDEVWYGGAFFLPSGFSQSMQNQVDLMRWDNFSLNNASQDWGGIIIQNSDKQARLKRFNVSGDYTDVSTPFTFPENRWVWVEVHQKFSPTNGQAINEVYLDGALQSSSTTANTYGREITRIRYGLVAIGAGAQTNPLDLWLDRATISSTRVGPLSGSTTALAGDTNSDGKVDIVDLSTLLSRWGTNYAGADFNKDLTVNIFDLSILLSNYGKTSPPPTGTPINQTLGFNTLNSVVSDDFTGASGVKPDSTRWGAKTFTATNGSVVYWNGLNNVQLDGTGNLDIFAQKTASGWNSSWISGNKSYTGTRYVEARARVAGGSGPWSAPIWEWDAPYGATALENDVIEQLGTEPTSYHTTLHPIGVSASSKLNNTNQTLSNDYHTYGAAVYADRVDYYFDGAKIQTITKAELSNRWGFDTTAMVLNINLDMGGWGGTPSPSLPSPTHMLVDYIRVYTP